MSRPEQLFDWQQIVDEQIAEPASVSRDRLRWILAAFALALAVIFGRAVQLEYSYGDAYREVAARPIERTEVLSAPRGRILARDGTVLAHDRVFTGLAVEYRYLQTPSDPAWLRRQARARLKAAERRKPARVEEMERVARGELDALHERLARLCKLSPERWQARTLAIQNRVEALAEHVNQRRQLRFQEQRAQEEQADAELSLGSILTGLFAPPEQLTLPNVVIVEQTAYHRVFDNVTPAMAEQIERSPDVFAGVKLIQYNRRDYPLGSAAANLVGHVGARSSLTSDIQEPPGLMGSELQFDAILRAQPGEELYLTDHGGKRLSSHMVKAAVPGGDVVLAIDAQLQRTVETLLDRALRRREQSHPREPAGGAIVVMDVRTGDVLCAVSGPRFDPQWFAAGDPRVVAVLHDPRQPMFDRALKMAIPPGSVFKPLTALALVERKVIQPDEPFFCQGYLSEPDRQRCQIYRQHGIGHEEITLADALARSCNVYFFHHAAVLGAAPLLDWSSRFGFGQPTQRAIESEASGHLPSQSQLRKLVATEAMSIGQGVLTATPLQVARMYAAIANGGYLLSPRLVREPVLINGSTSEAELSESERIVGLSEGSLKAVREGLRRTVQDPNGTAYGSVRLASTAIAGKTGTAETGGGRQDHAWFAGYVPADEPRLAFVVVLEHAGSGAIVAGSVAKSLVQRLEQLGYFGPSKAAENGP